MNLRERMKRHLARSLQAAQDAEDDDFWSFVGSLVLGVWDAKPSKNTRDMFLGCLLDVVTESPHRDLSFQWESSQFYWPGDPVDALIWGGRHALSGHATSVSMSQWFEALVLHHPDYTEELLHPSNLTPQNRENIDRVMKPLGEEMGIDNQGRAVGLILDQMQNFPGFVTFEADNSGYLSILATMVLSLSLSSAGVFTVPGITKGFRDWAFRQHWHHLLVAEGSLDKFDNFLRARLWVLINLLDQELTSEEASTLLEDTWIPRLWAQFPVAMSEVADTAHSIASIQMGNLSSSAQTFISARAQPVSDILEVAKATDIARTMNDWGWDTLWYANPFGRGEEITPEKVEKFSRRWFCGVATGPDGDLICVRTSMVEMPQELSPAGWTPEDAVRQAVGLARDLGLEPFTRESWARHQLSVEDVTCSRCQKILAKKETP